MTGFHDVQFPPDISKGAWGGPGYSTGIVTTVSGQELRDANRAMARGRWNVAHDPKKRGQVGELTASFRAPRPGLRLPLQGLDRLPGPGPEPRGR